jgi:hypothetical protein
MKIITQKNTRWGNAYLVLFGGKLITLAYARGGIVPGSKKPDITASYPLNNVLDIEELIRSRIPDFDQVPNRQLIDSRTTIAECARIVPNATAMQVCYWLQTGYIPLEPERERQFATLMNKGCLGWAPESVALTADELQSSSKQLAATYGVSSGTAWRWKKTGYRKVYPTERRPRGKGAQLVLPSLQALTVIKPVIACWSKHHKSKTQTSLDSLMKHGLYQATGAETSVLRGLRVFMQAVVQRGDAELTKRLVYCLSDAACRQILRNIFAARTGKNISIGDGTGCSDSAINQKKSALIACGLIADGWVNLKLSRSITKACEQWSK